MKDIYLDNNATTFLDPRVACVMQEWLQRPLANPSSPHAWGQQARALLSSCRRKIADVLGVSPEQILFTSGGTEGARLTLRDWLPKRPHSLVTSTIEHACVMDLMLKYAQEGASVRYLPVDGYGAVTVASVEEALAGSCDLLGLMAANNETGVRLDWEAIADRAFRKQIPFVVDGVALLGKAIWRIPRGVTAMFFSGHKIHGPQGVGFCYLANPPHRFTYAYSTQEFGLRPGTENLLGIVGLAEAVTLIEPDPIMKMERLRKKLEQGLLSIPGVHINGTGPKVANTVSATFTGCDGETLLIALDQVGVAVSLGSACSSGALTPSRVLQAMGLTIEQTRASLRFSLSRMTTEEEIDRTIALVANVRSAHG